MVYGANDLLSKKLCYSRVKHLGGRGKGCLLPIHALSVTYIDCRYVRVPPLQKLFGLLTISQASTITPTLIPVLLRYNHQLQKQ